MVSCNPMTSQPFAAQILSRVSMCERTVNAVDRCCANVERAERELLQPRPRPGGLVFLADGPPLRPLPSSLFPSKYPPPFTQLQVFSTQVLAFVLPTCYRTVVGTTLIRPRQTPTTYDTNTRVKPPKVTILLFSERPPVAIAKPIFLQNLNTSGCVSFVSSALVCVDMLLQ